LSHVITKLTYSFDNPRIIFGLNSITRLSEIIDELKCKKYLLVTDPNIEKTNIINEVKNYLKNIEGETYLIEPHEPYISDAEKIADFVRTRDYDVIIGVGGGSVLDLAKVAAFIVNNPGKVADYIGAFKVKNKGLPLILVPTTAGTGSEVSAAIVLSTSEGIKVAIWSPKVMADFAIVDPQLTLTMPPKITASSGLDALSHAFEALMSKRSNPLTDTIALESIKLIFKYLPLAFFQGDNIEARYYMALAATMAGLAFSNASLVAGHAIAYTYASEYKLPHGISCGLALPYIMDFNLPTCIDKFIRAAKIMDLPIGNLSDYEISIKVIKNVKKIIKTVKAPVTLSDIGVSKNEIPKLAKSLITDYARLLVYNPRRLEYEDALDIFNRMWEGKIGEE